MSQVKNIINQLYRSEAAKILAVLTRIFGTHNFELAEDVLQDAFNQALIKWEDDKIPEKPVAWLIKTAKNKAIDNIRKHKNHLQFSNDLSLLLESEWSLHQVIEEEFTDEKIQNDLLRMIFLCCRPEIKPENRIPFILRTLCGFNIHAISRALMIPEEAIKKRLSRTKKKLKEMSFDLPETKDLTKRMDSVHTVLYLLFNEGFYSTNNKNSLNRQLCFQAISLTESLINEYEIANQDTAGLLALMHFHLSRINTRVNKQGFNIPLDLQDRSLWDQTRIEIASQCLSSSLSLTTGASGRFPTEALIAQEHCLAKTFEETNWENIVELYQRILIIQPSPVAELNQAIAIAYAGNIEQAVNKTKKLCKEKSLSRSHLPFSVLAHLFAKLGNQKQALHYAEISKNKGGTSYEHKLMFEQLERLLS